MGIFLYTYRDPRRIRRRRRGPRPSAGRRPRRRRPRRRRAGRGVLGARPRGARPSSGLSKVAAYSKTSRCLKECPETLEGAFLELLATLRSVLDTLGRSEDFVHTFSETSYFEPSYVAAGFSITAACAVLPAVSTTRYRVGSVPTQQTIGRLGCGVCAGDSTT